MHFWRGSDIFFGQQVIFKAFLFGIIVTSFLYKSGDFYETFHPPYMRQGDPNPTKVDFLIITGATCFPLA